VSTVSLTAIKCNEYLLILTSCAILVLKNELALIAGCNPINQATFVTLQQYNTIHIQTMVNDKSPGEAAQRNSAICHFLSVKDRLILINNRCASHSRN
jgi:hypothetical protein